MYNIFTFTFNASQNSLAPKAPPRERIAAERKFGDSSPDLHERGAKGHTPVRRLGRAVAPRSWTHSRAPCFRRAGPIPQGCNFCVASQGGWSKHLVGIDAFGSCCLMSPFRANFAILQPILLLLLLLLLRWRDRTTRDIHDSIARPPRARQTPKPRPRTYHKLLCVQNVGLFSL